MQPHCPLPIKLVAGWVVEPRLRARLQYQVQKELRSTRLKQPGEWFAVNAQEAEQVLAGLAAEAGGKAWRLRKYRSSDAAFSSPRPRPIITPFGRFHSAAEAGRACGISRAAVSQRALGRSPGWRYADDTRPQPDLKPLGRPPKRDDDDDDED